MTLTFRPRHTALLGGAISALLYGYLALNSQAYGELNLAQFLFCSAVCAFISFVVWWHHNQANEEIPLVTLLGFALLFRLIGFFTFPILEDDFYRYLWDARMTFEHGSPYGITPASYFDTDLTARFEIILDTINYPEVATVYGPVCQWIFALGFLISPGEVWPLQLIFGLADLALILVLLTLARPTAVLLYAWSPLVLKEFVITAHPDIVGALLLLTAFLQYQRGRYLWVAALVALATGVKIFAIIALPFLIGVKWRAWLTFIVVAGLISLPFGVLDAWAPEGLRSMGSDWLFNAPIYALLGIWFSIPGIKLALLASLAGGCAIYLIYCLRDWPSTNIRIDLLFATLFLSTPALNPWYLVWLLPFAVIAPSLWAWTASFALLLSYASGINLAQPDLEPYQHPNWVLVVEFGSIVLAAVIGLFYGTRQPRQADRTLTSSQR